MSFDIALSGIQAIDQQLDQISNNIANSGTYGFKSSRDNFAALYADGGTANGTNIGSTSQSMGVTGGLVNTGDKLNAAINGAGFFVVKTAQGALNYTRVGLFGTDTSGYVIDPSGNRVQGNSVTPPSTTLGPVGDIKVPTGQIPAVATTSVATVANMSADWTTTTGWVTPVPADPAAGTAAIDAAGYNSLKTSSLTDSLGVQHTLTQYFVKTGVTTVDVHYVVDGTELGSSPATLTFDSNGQLVTPNATTPAAPLAIASLLDGASDMTVSLDYTGTTQFAGTASATVTPNGYASGSYRGIEIGADGSVIATYSNNQQQVVGNLTVATFANVNGLQPVDNTSWAATTTSGAANNVNAGVGSAGTLTIESLEQSNVDITSQLVSLMTSQRNYQANSKVIQTEDTMLQSLMQALQ